MNRSSDEHAYEALADQLDRLAVVERAGPDEGFESRVLAAADAGPSLPARRVPGRRRSRFVLPLAGTILAAGLVVVLVPIFQVVTAPQPVEVPRLASLSSDQEVDLLDASFDVLESSELTFDVEIDILSEALGEADGRADEDTAWLWGLEETEASL